MTATRARILDSLDAIPPGDWDALHDGRNPFVSHAFLSAMERTGCLRPDWGWAPHHLTLWDGGTLVAAAPMYLKSNSHGEFVFDHAWAHAYAQHGVDYYPKWLCGIPYSPVTGPRLLARDAAGREALVRAMAELTRAQGLSSAHANFLTPEDDAAFDHDWLQREDVQYHWRNTAGWMDFESFLGAMDHRHRKNIRQERARIARAGVVFRQLHGNEAGEDELAAMHGFYLQTFAEYGNSPALTLDFMREIARTMPNNILIIIGYLDDQPISGALCLRGTDTLHGRYWGSNVQLPGLHFETCYYQGIDYCLREGLARFEPGAQGEHKLARGFLPETVRSRHFIADPRFRAALRDWCTRERDATGGYAAHLAGRTPFRKP